MTKPASTLGPVRARIPERLTSATPLAKVKAHTSGAREDKIKTVVFLMHFRRRPGPASFGPGLEINNTRREGCLHVVA